MDLRYNPIGQPTGRPKFPGFVARSQSNPDAELRDPQAWRRSWMQALERLAVADYTNGKYSRRWIGDGCA